MRCLPLVLLLCVGCTAPPADLPAVDDDDATETPTPPAASLTITDLSPSPAPGGVAFSLRIDGTAFAGGAGVSIDGQPVAAELVDGALVADAPALARGVHSVLVSQGSETAEATFQALNAPPVVGDVGDVSGPEEADLDVTLDVSDLDGDDIRVWVTGLPPGASWDEASRTVRFRPDFTQGPATWTVDVVAQDPTRRVESSFTISVEDSIQPPAPVVIETIYTSGGYSRLTLDQVTDDFLDAPGHAGRTFTARVAVPSAATAANPLPVRVSLHGFGGSASTSGSESEFRVYPHDDFNTYWWGYSDQHPDGDEDAAGATSPPYTARRVLHLVAWVLANHEGADPDRVYVRGGSMGGAGATVIGLLWARHFAWVYATIGQTIARNHRPLRVDQLSGHWGSPETNAPDGAGLGCWDRQDLARALEESPEARDQHVFLKHGKDDPTIHFGAVVHASPLTGFSFYDALQQHHVAHYAVWDEGGHGSSDPVLGGSWWHQGWNPVFDDVAQVRRGLAHPAFTASSVDDDPGDGTGNGNQSWSEDAGYAGSVSTPGDTGWSGDLAGARGRFLRWESAGIVDTIEEFAVPLFVLDGDGEDPPQSGYPTVGDQLDGDLPVLVDVTPRRVQGFRARPGEVIAWSFGADEGTVIADDVGSVTVPQLAVDTAPTVLRLWRD